MKAAMARSFPALIALATASSYAPTACTRSCHWRGDDRGDGRRTLVYVEGIEEPIIASRSEGAIARDVAGALGRGRSRDSLELPGQEALF